MTSVDASTDRRRRRNDGTPWGAPSAKSTADSLVEKDASSYLGMSVAWLRLSRQRRTGPAFIQIGRAVRYRRADLDAWLSAHRVDPREAQ